MLPEQTKIPMWLRKPQHKKEVVASSKGWIVKETGELLTRVPNLEQKLAEYFGTAVSVVTETIVPSAPSEPAEPTPDEEAKLDQSTDQEEQQEDKEEQNEDAPVQEETEAKVPGGKINNQRASKRRGRPPRNKQ
jgi:hypothetical protein